MFWPSLESDSVFKNIVKSSVNGGVSTYIVASNEPDSILAGRQLISALLAQGVKYSYHSARGFRDVRNRVLGEAENNPDLRSVILINCGGRNKLESEFREIMHEDLFFYVFDCHRPVSHYNLSNQLKNVIVVADDIDLNAVPEDQDEDAALSGEDDEEDENDDEITGDNEEEDLKPDQEDELNDTTKISSIQATPERLTSILDFATAPPSKKQRREKYYAYYRGSYFGDPASHLVYLMLEPGQYTDRTDSIWCAVVAVSSRYWNHELSDQSYQELARFYGDIAQANFANRPGFRASSDDHQTKVPRVSECEIFCVEDELCIPLYRKWTLKDALLNSEYLANRLNAWAPDSDLNMLLVTAGISLRNAGQQFEHQSEKLNKKAFLEAASKMGLDHVTFPSFTARFYYNLLSAMDAAMAIQALLDDQPAEDEVLVENRNHQRDEIPLLPNDILHAGGMGEEIDNYEYDHDLRYQDCFNHASDACSFSSMKFHYILDGIEVAKRHLELLIEESKSIILGKLVLRAGDFRYAVVRIQDDDKDDRRSERANFFSLPSSVVRLAQHVVNANQGANRWVGASALSFILVVARSDKALVAGVPCPRVHGDVCLNPFGKTFELVAKEIDQVIDSQRFNDPFVVEIKTDDVDRFLMAVAEVIAE